MKKKLTSPLFLRILDSTKTGKVRIIRDGKPVQPTKLDGHAQECVDAMEVRQQLQSPAWEQAIILELMLIEDTQDTSVPRGGKR